MTHVSVFTTRIVKETIAKTFVGLPQYRYISLRPYSGSLFEAFIKKDWKERTTLKRLYFGSSDVWFRCKICCDARKHYLDLLP